MTITIAPSLLSADFSRLAEEMATVEEFAEVLHIDVMDGHFVPNLTLGPALVRSLRPHSRLLFDCHLMIREPQRYIEAFLESGADMISVHIEAEPHLQRALAMIRNGGARAGIAVNPATSVELLTDAIEYCDYVLLMTVNPGFGGQKFIAGVVPKIARLRSLISSRGLSVEIEVDGGIDAGTAPLVCGAGANILVAGSAVFGRPDRREAIETIRAAASSMVV